MTPTRNGQYKLIDRSSRFDPSTSLSGQSTTTGNQVRSVNHEAWGVPGKKSWITLADVGVCFIVYVGFAVAMVTIYYATFAVYLGQTNQLIVIGLCLIIMGRAMTRQIMRISPLIECRYGESALQNYEGLLFNDPWRLRLGILPRAILLALFVLPLGLSAGYKNYVGGSTVVLVTPQAGRKFAIGITAEPGHQRIGAGLSILTEAFLPFWIAPALNATYGFNLYIHSNETAVLVDALSPQEIMKMRQELSETSFFIFKAPVLATVGEEQPISSTDRVDSDFWDDLRSQYGVTNSKSISLYDIWYNEGYHNGMLAGAVNTGYTDGISHLDNNTVFYLSTYNYTAPTSETFGDFAQKIVMSRRACTATWNITTSSVKLIGVEGLQDLESSRRDIALQRPIVDTRLETAVNCGPMMHEYQVRFRNFTANPVAPIQSADGTYSSYTGHPPNISMVPALATAMLWSQLTTYFGVESVPFDKKNSSGWKAVTYTKDASEIKLYKQAQTLKTEPGLLILILVYPILITLSTAIKALLLRSVPLGDGFGITSLLGAVQEEDLHLLKGSALSGKLRKNLKLRFDVREDTETREGAIQVRLGHEPHPSKIRSGVNYG